MNKQREALDALEGIHSGNMTPMAEQAWNKAINAIREALAEPEQKSACFKCGHAWHPDECVNTAPPARKPLTDEQIRKLARDAEIKLMNDEALALGYLPASIKKFARAIERAHGIGEE